MIFGPPPRSADMYPPRGDLAACVLPVYWGSCTTTHGQAQHLSCQCMYDSRHNKPNMCANVGAPNIKEHVPENSIIDVGDFPDHDVLSDHLLHILQNESLYESYHSWRYRWTPLPHFRFLATFIVIDLKIFHPVSMCMRCLSPLSPCVFVCMFVCPPQTTTRRFRAEICLHENSLKVKIPYTHLLTHTRLLAHTRLPAYSRAHTHPRTWSRLTSSMILTHAHTPNTHTHTHIHAHTHHDRCRTCQFADSRRKDRCVRVFVCVVSVVCERELSACVFAWLRWCVRLNFGVFVCVCVGMLALRL